MPAGDPTPRPICSGSRGFAFIWLLFWVALLGVGLASAGQLWSQAAKRERERELLFIGDQFRRAIASYYEASPGIKRYPRRLEDLLADDRVPVTRRHLRRIWPDPMTGKADWGLVMQGDQILGVFSQSRDAPIKRANFRAADAVFADALSYADWRFVHTPSGAPSAGAAALAADRAALAEAARDRTSTSLTGGGQAAATPASGNAQPAASPPPAVSVGIPGEGWACAAGYANELRACGQASAGRDRETVQACRQTARQRYQSCLGSSADGGRPVE